MATDLQDCAEPKLSSLLSGVIDDVQTLIKQEMALARREMADELGKVKQAAMSLSIGLALAALGGLFLLLMVVHILSEETPLKLWHAYAIVGGLLALGGLGLLLFARAKVADFHLVPPRTAETMKENVRWFKNRS